MSRKNKSDDQNKPGDKKKQDTKKKKLGFKKTFANTVFALKTVKAAAPYLITVQLATTILDASIYFFGDSYLLRYILNSYTAGRDSAPIIMFIVVMGVMAFAVSMTGHAVYRFFAYKKYIALNAYIEKQLFRKSHEVELACFEDPVFYDKYVRAMDEAPEKLSSDLRQLLNLVWTIITLSANSFLLFFIDPVLIVFGLFPLLLGFLRKRENEIRHEYDTKAKTINRRKKYIRRTFYLNEYAKEQRLSGISAFLYKTQYGTFEEYRQLVRDFGVKKAFLKFSQRFGMEGLVILGAMLYAAFQTLVTGNMQVGDCLVVFNSIGNVSYSLRYIVENLTEFQKNALYIEDYLKFMNYEPKIKHEGCPVAVPGDLRFENVSFRYAGAKDDIIKNISFTVKKGEKIALVGQNGSGKSTLVKLIMRLYDPTEGRITVDGEDIKTIEPQKYRDMFGVVFQECRCFSMSVAENVLLRPLREGDDEIITEALKQSGGYDKIMSLKNGIGTTLTREFDDNGTVLSGGELQKVQLARIFAVPTPFVILDEPSSALDPIAEYNMFENMVRACGGRSAVFISHRLSSATVADHVILLEDGVIAEEGTHIELMEKNEKYARLFRMQAENYIGIDGAAGAAAGGGVA